MFKYLLNFLLIFLMLSSFSSAKNDMAYPTTTKNLNAEFLKIPTEIKPTKNIEPQTNPREIIIDGDKLD